MAKRLGPRPTVDPTPAQIEAMCAEIQATWDEWEFAIRRGKDPAGLNTTRPRPLGTQLVKLAEFGIVEVHGGAE